MDVGQGNSETLAMYPFIAGAKVSANAPKPYLLSIDAGSLATLEYLPDYIDVCYISNARVT